MSNARATLLFYGVILIVANVAFIQFYLSKRKRNSTSQRKRPSKVFSIRRLLAQLIGLFGVMCSFVGGWPLIERDPSGHADWKLGLGMVVFGQFVVFCAWLMIKKTKS